MESPDMGPQPTSTSNRPDAESPIERGVWNSEIYGEAEVFTMTKPLDLPETQQDEFPELQRIVEHTVVHNEACGLCGGHVYWGTKVSAEEDETISKMGFPYLFRTRISDITLAEEVGLNAVLENITFVLEQANLDPSQLNGVYFESSTSIFENGSRKIAKLINAQNASHFLNIHAACSGSGLMITRALSNKEVEGPILCVSMNDITTLGESLRTDNLSPSTFSTMGAAHIIYPQMNFSTLNSNSNWPFNGIRVIPDTGEVHSRINPKGLPALRAHMPYGHLLDQGHNISSGDYLQFDPCSSTLMVRLPPVRDPSWGIEMQGPATAKFFIDNAIPVALEGWQAYLASGHKPPNENMLVVSHYPSEVPYKRIAKLLTRNYNLPLTFLDHVPSGNGSGTTFSVMLTHAYKELTPGQDVMFLIFGAGGTFECEIVRVKPG